MNSAHQESEATNRQKQDLVELVKRKEDEYKCLSSKVNESHTQLAHSQRKIKDIEEELAEALSRTNDEAKLRTKAEKQRTDLTRELEELMECLAAMKTECNGYKEQVKKTEAEVLRVKRAGEQESLHREFVIGNLKNKHQEAVNEMAKEIDALNKIRNR